MQLVDTVYRLEQRFTVQDIARIVLLLEKDYSIERFFVSTRTGNSPNEVPAWDVKFTYNDLDEKVITLENRVVIFRGFTCTEAAEMFQQMCDAVKLAEQIK